VSGSFSNFNDWWSYDVSSNVWTQNQDFPSSKRHHPFYFGLSDKSYTGFGHSRSFPYIERDWYMYDLEQGQWARDTDFASYSITTEGISNSTFQYSEQPVTTEARVAGTQFSIELPLVLNNDDGNDSSSALSGSLGFVLSGDGNDHGVMATGEFHAFYPPTTDSTVMRPAGITSNSSWWRELPPHPGRSRWAPGSFVMRGTARAYFTSGLDRGSGTWHSDLWCIDLSPLFTGASQESSSTYGTKMPTFAALPTIQPTNLPSSTPPFPTMAPSTIDDDSSPNNYGDTSAAYGYCLVMATAASAVLSILVGDWI